MSSHHPQGSSGLATHTFVLAQLGRLTNESSRGLEENAASRISKRRIAPFTSVSVRRGRRRPQREESGPWQKVEFAAEDGILVGGAWRRPASRSRRRRR